MYIRKHIQWTIMVRLVHQALQTKLHKNLPKILRLKLVIFYASMNGDCPTRTTSINLHQIIRIRVKQLPQTTQQVLRPQSRIKHDLTYGRTSQEFKHDLLNSRERGTDAMHRSWGRLTLRSIRYLTPISLVHL